MPLTMQPIRRVVTANDADGRSAVLWDSAAPNINVGTVAASAGMTDVWVFDRCPAPVDGMRDDGRLPFSFEPPSHGGHLRIVQSAGREAGHDPARDSTAVPEHPPRRRPGSGTWDRGGQNAFSSPIHRSPTVDVGVLLEGRRTLLLDEGDYPLLPGDVVVQLGNWHGWTNPDGPSLMAFVMLGAVEDDAPGEDADIAGGDQALQQAQQVQQVQQVQPVQAVQPVQGRIKDEPAARLLNDARPWRRLVTVDGRSGRSHRLTDSCVDDVLLDPARPGFSSTRIWATCSTPAVAATPALVRALPPSLLPPPGGSLFRIIVLPPDASWRPHVEAADVQAFFHAAGTPDACSATTGAPHPYMQRTDTLDLCVVLEGQPALVLDAGTVPLQATDTVVQRATRHAWSNPTNAPCVIAISSHDAHRPDAAAARTG